MALRSNLPYVEIEHLEDLHIPFPGCTLKHLAFQYIDFTDAGEGVLSCRFEDCCFLGCVIPPEMQEGLDSSSLVFPRMGMRYKAFTNELYSADTLYEGYDPSDDEGTFGTCFDSCVYHDYIVSGKRCDDIKETLARSIHDLSISNAMNDLLYRYPEHNVVAVMGGHALKRTDPSYAKVAFISKKLTEQGYLMVSGGGPGAMEATHFGAWMAGRSDEDVDVALHMLSKSPSFKDGGWLRTAFEVRSLFPQTRFHSLGIPTWFYGHEPATPFATDIAKYFDNSVREDGIIKIAKGGIIYSPGSAGTMQEIFQDAAKNHYMTFGCTGPMIFLGEKYYTEEMPVFPLLSDMIERGKYSNLDISITDDPHVVIEKIKSIHYV